MPYFPESTPTTAPESFEESVLYPPIESFADLGLSLAPLLGSEAHPEIRGESYRQSDGSTIFVAMSDVPMDAQQAADVLQTPLDDLRPWKSVQFGLRSVGFQRRRISRAMRRAGLSSDLEDVHRSASMLSTMMSHTSQVREHHADVEVLSLSASYRAADKNLRQIPVKDLAKLMNVVLGRSMEPEQLQDLKNWLQAMRKHPERERSFEDFFEQLRDEMEAEGYRIDPEKVSDKSEDESRRGDGGSDDGGINTNDDIINNLPTPDYQRLKDALWQVIFERFTIHEEFDDAIGMSGYIRSGDVPPGVDRGKETKIDLGALGVDLLLEFGGVRGDVTFLSPPLDWQLRKVLVWQRDNEGGRTLRFDTNLHRKDPETGAIFHHSPLLGAAALAARFNPSRTYTGALDRINPCVRQPGRVVTKVGRAGLFPLVARKHQENLFASPYMANLERMIETD